MGARPVIIYNYTEIIAYSFANESWPLSTPVNIGMKQTHYGDVLQNILTPLK